MEIDLTQLADVGLVGAFLVMLMVGRWVRLEREVTREEAAHQETKDDRDEWKAIARNYEKEWAEDVLPLLKQATTALTALAEKSGRSK